MKYILMTTILIGLIGCTSRVDEALLVGCRYGYKLAIDEKDLVYTTKERDKAISVCVEGLEKF